MDYLHLRTNTQEEVNLSQTVRKLYIQSYYVLIHYCNSCSVLTLFTVNRKVSICTINSSLVTIKNRHIIEKSVWYNVVGRDRMVMF